MMPNDFQDGNGSRVGVPDAETSTRGWGATIAMAIGLGLLLLLLAWGFADALSYDDYSADYWDPAGHYRQIDEERRLDREAQERDWMRREGICEEEDY